MAQGHTRLDLNTVSTNDEKPGSRWEVSPPLGIEAYNYNVAVLESGERLSQNAFHYHEHQSEFFHVVEGKCRVETVDDSFDLATDQMVSFEPGAIHLLHNPFEEQCRLVAIGTPPDGRYPVHQVQSFEELLTERYPDGDRSSPSEVV